MKDTAIMVVSFGTSYEETRKKTIEAIETEIQAAFPDYPVYCAWTSRMIVKKLRERDGLWIDTPGECLERLIAAGYKKVYVQPTHFLHGYEYSALKSELHKYHGQFEKIICGEPLLTSMKDVAHVAEVLNEFYQTIGSDEALIWMGHGTGHHANAVYCALDHWLKGHGMERSYIATVEGYPTLSNVIPELKEKGYKKLHLAPLMLVAGDHALNDMAGDGEHAWKVILEHEGFEVACHVNGLGEVAGIREIFIEHLKAIM